MIDKEIQLLVGPTALPNRVMNAMCHPAISHRGQYYYDVQKEVCDGVKEIFQTKQDVLSLTTSGTGALEAVIQNLFKENDELIVPITGEFGRLIQHVAEPYGLKVKTVNFEYGETANVEKTLAACTDKTKAVFMVHNESSTGVLDDIQAFGNAIAKLPGGGPLFIVDGVSSVGGADVKMDEWHIDVLITASQKCLMAPPGLAFVALSDRAWDVVETVANDRYYFNFRKDRKYIHQDRTVHTPATHTLLAVHESLKTIREEGFANVLQRHEALSAYVRKTVQSMGLCLFAHQEDYCSPTLTCISVPGQAKYYVAKLKENNIAVGGGKSPLDNDTFRIGTMGYVSMNDVVACMNVLSKIVEKNDAN